MGRKRDAWVENRRHIRGYPHGKSLHIPRSVLKSLTRACAICGETVESKLRVHHMNGNSLDNDVENLQVLCPGCHRSETPNTSGYDAFLEHDARRYYEERRRS